MTQAVDPAVLHEGDAVLERTLEELDRELEARIQGFEEALEARVVGPLRDGLEAAATAHRRLAREAELLPEADRPCPDWPCLRSYRDGVAREVVGPLLELLREGDPTGRTSTLWEEFRRGVEGVAETLPEKVLRTEPGDVLAGTPGDGLLRRARKLARRMGRGVARPFRGSAPRLQNVPLRRLAREVFQGEALPGVVDVLERLHKHHASAVQGAEHAVGAWLRDWFPVEDPTHPAPGPVPRATAQELERLTEGLAPILEEISRDGEDDLPGDSTTEDSDPSAPEAGGGDEGETEEEAWGPAQVAAAFQAALEAAATRPSLHRPALDQVRGGVERLGARLQDRIREAGTGLARPTPTSEVQRRTRLKARMERGTAGWSRWQAAAVGRIRLAAEVLALRRALEVELEGLLKGVLDASVLHLDRVLGEARNGLQTLREEAGRPDSPLHATDDREQVAEAAEGYLEQAEALLEEAVGAPLHPDRTHGAVRGVVDRVVDRVDALARGLPEAVEVHPLRDPLPPLDVAQSVRTVEFRDIVAQSLDALHLEALRTSAAPVLAFLEQARGECREVPKVVAYNLTAARDELLAEEEDEETDADAVLEDARSLTLQGLERTAQALDQIRAGSLGPFHAFAERAHGVIHRALVQAHDRLTVEKAVQEQIRDVRSLLEGWLRRLEDRAGGWWQGIRRWTERSSRRLSVRVQRLIRKGKSAVGAQELEEGEAERAMEVLRGIPALLEPLPLVYRRLYSFQPVSDPSLLMGREEETAWVSRRWAAWQEGLRSPSVLTGAVTVGATSFLNVLAVTLFQDARVVRIPFLRRRTSPDSVAERVAEGLRNAEVLGEEETGPWTLDDLAERLLDRTPEEGGRPLVLLVEHLSHLFLRVPGGAQTVERFLAFQARTSPVVFWLTCTSDPFWKLLRKMESRATTLVTAGTLSGMDRSELETLIMARHQRSGVPLEFLPPRDPNPLLKRKLGRARTEEARQEILRSEFFDRLHRGSQGNVIMAILLWLKSADFTTREGWLRLHPPRPLRFGFMDELDLELDFALMALVEHTSLTVEELARVFQVDEDDAFQTLEALRGRMLLDRLDTRGGLLEPVEQIEEGVRYRIPPILGQVVSNYLRNQNILH